MDSICNNKKNFVASIPDDQERYRYISDAIMGVVYSCTRDTSGDYIIDWITGAVENVTGYTVDELQQKGCWKCLVHPQDVAIFEKNITSLSAGESSNCELRIIDQQGKIRWIRAFSKIVKNNDVPETHRLFGGYEDITERKQDEERLRLSASVFEHAHEGIIITDANARIIDVNPTFSDITGYDCDDVLNLTPRVLKSDVHGSEFYDGLWQSLNEDGFWRGEIWNRKKNSDVYPELLTISAVKDELGRVTNYVGIFTDITELKEQQRNLETLAHFDALTQLPNRTLLSDHIKQALDHTSRSESLLAVCYLDLDGFKPVNDGYGHAVGDRLLIEVAERLKDTLREGDMLSRLGGDEFVLLLTNIDTIDECETILTKVLKVISKPYTVQPGKKSVISASVGVTIFPFDDAEPDTLLRHADQAMYQAKQLGRNQYHLFDLEHDRQAQIHRERVARIKEAFKNNEFCLYYQPKIDMKKGVVIGAEALIRWQHPDRGTLLPDDFLPIIESTEFASVLGDWVLETALAQMETWQQAGFDFSISVNISAKHLQDAGFAGRLKELLARHSSVSAKKLKLEVLETTALEDVSLVSMIMNECREFGVSFAIDDFGTGYSSLTYLKRLPADTLKIDRSFVHDMLDDPDDKAIIEGIIGLASVFNRAVIAEGVETEAHGDALYDLGCELAQGFGIARPMPAEQLELWVTDYPNKKTFKK
ncbi:MAG: EAL domain-containing protein [Gammaproteobacteria bacterium]|nr:EAL domain-containing protein [Gammaproteobacteria bacterium]